MDLDEFVRQTLVDVMNGVKAAQEELHGDGSGIVAVKGQISPRPAGRSGSTTGGRPLSDIGSPIDQIEFDVAVTAEEGAEAKGGVKVWGLNVGGGVASKEAVVSRVKFSVPVALPLPDK